MAENSANSAPKAQRGRPFKKGESGNPGGRPKGVVTRVKALVGEDGRRALRVLWKIAKDTSAKPSERIAAAEALLNRGFGKASSPIELAGAEGGPVEFVIRDLAKE